MPNIALIGAGNMGFAMLKMWAKFERNHISVVEPNAALRFRAEGLGVKTYLSADDVPYDFSPDVMVVATKPEMVGEVVERYTTVLQADGFIVSVAAGVSLKEIASHAKGHIPIFRCMPNTPAAIGEGMIVCCQNEHTNEKQRALAEELLTAIGHVVFLDDEGMMDAVTAVSGSGPGYVFHFIEALCQAAIYAGLDDSLALLLAKQTVYGAAKLALISDELPSMLREQVTSPNGTTAAGLNVLMANEANLTKLLVTAVQAAKRRSIELNQCEH